MKKITKLTTLLLTSFTLLGCGGSETAIVICDDVLGVQARAYQIYNNICAGIIENPKVYTTSGYLSCIQKYNDEIDSEDSVEYTFDIDKIDCYFHMSSKCVSLYQNSLLEDYTEITIYRALYEDVDSLILVADFTNKTNGEETDHRKVFNHNEYQEVYDSTMEENDLQEEDEFFDFLISYCFDGALGMSFDGREYHTLNNEYVISTAVNLIDTYAYISYFGEPDGYDFSKSLFTCYSAQFGDLYVYFNGEKQFDEISSSNQVVEVIYNDFLCTSLLVTNENVRTVSNNKNKTIDSYQVTSSLDAFTKFIPDLSQYEEQK